MSGEQPNTLANVGLFRGLPDATRQALEKRCRWRNFAAHEQIIDRQSTSQDVYFIVHGRVRVVNYSMSGREIAFDEIESGSYFGELAAIDGEPRSANIVALETTTVAMLSSEAFRAALEENPELALQLMLRMSSIIRASTERIMDLSTLGANNRIYAELLRLAKSDIREDNTAVITPVPIHGDIASRVSTTRETVARVLSELSRLELVKRERNRLVILDLEHLTEMVEQFQVE